MSAVPHLQKQLKDLTQHPLAGFRVEVGDDLFTWTVWFSGPSGTYYHPGQYKAVMTFPNEFPFKPPEFRIVSSIWHPNVYDDGKVCISILHEPGEDAMNSLETALERWTPVQSIGAVMVSIVSLLADPDPAEAGAPANVEALSMYRKNKDAFIKKCKENAQKSLAELPPGWIAPPEHDEKPMVAREISTLGNDDFIEDDCCDDEPVQKSQSAAYASELEQIRAMGVGSDKSDEEITEMLNKYKGDLSRVIDMCC